MNRRRRGIHDDRLRQIVEKAVAQGWSQRRSKSNHLILTSPAGQTVVMPSTPSDWRGLNNALSYLKRYGLA